MKTFNEWKEESELPTNPNILLDKVETLTHQIETELKSFQGDRFEGLLELIGGLKQLQYALAEIKHNCVGDMPTGNGKPKAPRAGKKVNWKQTISKGVRDEEKEDMGDHYIGHMATNGEVEPLKVLKKKK